MCLDCDDFVMGVGSERWQFVQCLPTLLLGEKTGIATIHCLDAKDNDTSTSTSIRSKKPWQRGMGNSCLWAVGIGTSS